MTEIAVAEKNTCPGVAMQTPSSRSL